jgi:hypothetical protein
MGWHWSIPIYRKPTKVSRDLFTGNHVNMTFQAYRIDRAIDDGAGRHYRRRSSVERHLAAAPPIREGHGGHRYPKHFRNKEELFSGGESLFEFPTMDYPYHLQNARGHILGAEEGVAGFTRTVTNRSREIKGVIYHPYTGKPKRSNRFVRAFEVRSWGWRGWRR